MVSSEIAILSVGPDPLVGLPGTLASTIMSTCAVVVGANRTTCMPRDVDPVSKSAVTYVPSSNTNRAASPASGMPETG